MSLDTPARIAVLGAGPIGVEATLYARYLGYDVDLYERSHVGDHVRRWGHVRMFTPWQMNCSPLGVAALKAQDPQWQAPDASEHPTGREFVERYLAPLSQSDLVIDALHEETEVLAIGRPNMLKSELFGDPARADEPFRLLVQTSEGHQRIAEADAVIDATGVYSQHNWMGRGGVPAAGERDLAAKIEYRLPDVAGKDRSRYAGRRLLVVGAGLSAATTITSLATLEPACEVTWITRREPSSAPGPVSLTPDDPLAERVRCARAANALAATSKVRHLAGTSIESIASASKNSLLVQLSGLHEKELEVDEIIANVGYRPKLSLLSELPVAFDPATDAPLPFDRSVTSGPAALVTTEPDFYILGAKRRGRDSRFLLSDGHREIRDLFTILGDRVGLDLYATAR
ncbi:MAG TPA: FAD-dependent oxidoreductase [Pirellulales bacterium]|nr:FAD-dependent oxidoreductase [Pirellulales bacterium]